MVQLNNLKVDDKNHLNLKGLNVKEVESQCSRLKGEPLLMQYLRWLTHNFPYFS